MAEIRTKGNVLVNEIKVGDKHFQYECGVGMKLEVLTLPEEKDGGWVWKSKNLTTGKVVDYFVANDIPAHYGPNLYDYKAYDVNHYI